MRKPPVVRVAPASGFASSYQWVGAVDAAKHTPAIAAGAGGFLDFVGFDPNPGIAFYQCPGIVVLELSRSYGARDAGKHGDIIAETCGGALTAGAMRASKIVLVHPDEWAGQTEKPVRHQAIWHALSVDELKLLKAASGFDGDLLEYIDAACNAIALGKKPKYSHPVHNLLDAVGLYLFAVGRIRKGGARPR